MYIRYVSTLMFVFFMFILFINAWRSLEPWSLFRYKHKYDGGMCWFFVVFLLQEETKVYLSICNTLFPLFWKLFWFRHGAPFESYLQHAGLITLKLILFSRVLLLQDLRSRTLWVSCFDLEKILLHGNVR